MRRSLHLVTSLACLLATLTDAAAQVTAIEPARPRRGDAVRVRYDPDAPGARFSLEDEVHVIAFDAATPGARPRSLLMTHDDDGLLVAAFDLDADAAALELEFSTPRDWDRAASLHVTVADADGVPAPGATIERAMSDPSRADELLAEELRLHPDHVAAYRHRFLLAYALDPAGAADLIRAGLATLTASPHADSSAGRWSRAYASLALGDERGARRLVLGLLDDFPSDPITARAVADYEYLTYALQIDGDGPAEVDARKRRTIVAHPESSLARDALTNLAWKEDFPLEAVERSAAAWIADEPDHPEPRMARAKAAWLHGGDLARAADDARAACTILFEGRFRVAQDYAGAVTSYFLPLAFRLLGDIELARDRPTDALAAALMATRVARETDPRNPELEARVLDRLGDRTAAISAWIRALDAGSKDALTALQPHWRRAAPNVPFDTWLASQRPSSDPTDKPLAPAFTVATLAGTTFDLASLRGHVVVLNFWSLGCAPCKVEIPSLNQLVHEFADAPVDFIAFAPDDPAALRAYLTDHPFSYHQVPSASTVAQAYQVRSLPTHILIDPEGHIHARLTGGSKTRHEDLAPMLHRLLDSLPR